ncbi:MAG: preprotein translocase subunit YajC [Sphingobacteriales bacterium]|jgi:preprotein translocase subunit YajC|nr:preprotein translocase subunit YajC [Sphingobacteriales bacterium]
MLHQVLLMAPPAAGAQGGNPIMQFLPLILIFVVFYFFMIYPQIKKNKAQKKFREALGKGDKIITIGGVHAKILEATEQTFLIESEGTKLRIDRTAVSMEASQALNQPAKEEKK